MRARAPRPPVWREAEDIRAPLNPQPERFYLRNVQGENNTAAANVFVIDFPVRGILVLTRGTPILIESLRRIVFAGSLLRATPQLIGFLKILLLQEREKLLDDLLLPPVPEGEKQGARDDQDTDAPQRNQLDTPRPPCFVYTVGGVKESRHFLIDTILLPDKLYRKTQRRRR
jgi:hypothetical protein